MAKISLVVGHSAKSPGALAEAPISDTEYGFNTEVAQILASTLIAEHEVRIFFRDGVTIPEAYAQVEEWEPDLNMELHLNSHDDKTVVGTETLCVDRSKSFAGIIQESMCVALKRDLTGGNRGLKILTSPEQRGYASCSALEIPSILLEPIFCSNSAECELLLANMKRFVVAISEGVNHYLSAN